MVTIQKEKVKISSDKSLPKFLFYTINFSNKLFNNLAGSTVKLLPELC